MATPSRSDVDPTSTGTVETCIVRGARRTTHHEAALWTVALLTLALDVVTTTYGLRLGLAEMNPLVNALVPTFGVFGTFSVLKGSALLVGVTAWWLMPSAFRGVVPLGLSLPWAVAGVSNTALLVALYL